MRLRGDGGKAIKAKDVHLTRYANTSILVKYYVFVGPKLYYKGEFGAVSPRRNVHRIKPSENVHLIF